MGKTKRIKVRFHLGAGKHFMHWKIEYPNGDIKFINPAEFNFTMFECQLHNRPKTATGIHAGGEKVVCAWIWCEAVVFANFKDKNIGFPISYNPRIAPNWRDDIGQNLDNKKFGIIQSFGNKLFVYYV